MSEIYVQFQKIEDILDFVSVVSKCSHAVDLSSGRFGADGKSLMGVLAIGLDKPVKVQLQAEDEQLLGQQLKRYEVSQYHA